MPSETADLLVIGAGIVGLATAWRFQERNPGRRALVLEKESGVAQHQTGRNSGVIHSGLYYAPGSAKARNCRRGKRLLEDFCRSEGVRFERCGKVVVALDAAELPRLEALHERARQNGVACERIGPERLRELEPHAAGIAALHVPETGIVDYLGVCERLRARIEAGGGELRCGARVLRGAPDAAAHANSAPGSAAAASGARAAVELETTRGRVRGRWLVNCAGLYSDLVAERLGAPRPARIVPFRGEYYALAPQAQGLVQNLIYPVPDPRFPFLGVHFTRLVGGGVECGPNAVLAFAREGYTLGTLAPRELWDTLSYAGFWRFARAHGRMALAELQRSWSKAAFVRALQRLLPAIRAEQLAPAPAGVRAQLLAPEGRLVDDFAILRRGACVHVLNAPSPAATAALAIGDQIVDELAAELGIARSPQEPAA